MGVDWRMRSDVAAFIRITAKGLVQQFVFLLSLFSISHHGSDIKVSISKLPLYIYILVEGNSEQRRTVLKHFVVDVYMQLRSRLLSRICGLFIGGIDFSRFRQSSSWSPLR